MTEDQQYQGKTIIDLLNQLLTSFKPEHLAVSFLLSYDKKTHSYDIQLLEAKQVSGDKVKRWKLSNSAEQKV